MVRERGRSQYITQFEREIWMSDEVAWGTNDTEERMNISTEKRSNVLGEMEKREERKKEIVIE